MRTGYLVTAALAVVVSLIAKDLTLPLIAFAAIGVVDRMVTATLQKGAHYEHNDPARA
jgi:hypothetical protein